MFSMRILDVIIYDQKSQVFIVIFGHGNICVFCFIRNSTNIGWSTTAVETLSESTATFPGRDPVNSKGSGFELTPGLRIPRAYNVALTYVCVYKVLQDSGRAGPRDSNWRRALEPPVSIPWVGGGGKQTLHE